MTASELIAQLQSRGVVLRPHIDGEHLLVRPPPVGLDPALLALLKAQRDQVLEELRRQQGIAVLMGGEGTLVASEGPTGAVLVRSPQYGEVWLARDEGTAEELVAKLDASGVARPVLTYAEASLLRGKSPAMVQAVLTAKAAMPGSRLLQ